MLWVLAVIEQFITIFIKCILVLYLSSLLHNFLSFKFGPLLQVTSTLTFAAACASAGITVLIDNDLANCYQNHCARFETATAMAFISWFSVSPSFLLNFWSLASRWEVSKSNSSTLLLTWYGRFFFPFSFLLTMGWFLFPFSVFLSFFWLSHFEHLYFHLYMV